MASIYTPSVPGAFVPLGNTVTFLANTAPPAAVQAVQGGANNVSFHQYRIFNSGGNMIFLGWGSNSTIANNNATVVSTTANSLPIPSGAIEIISLPANTFITAITSSGNSQVYVTPGLGV